MKTTASSVASLLKKSCTTFIDNGTFSPKDVKFVCDKAGIEVNYDILKVSDKVGRGLYRYTGQVSTAPVVAPALKITADVQLVAPAPEPVRKEAVQRNDSYAHVPEINSEYVPFGEYRDIEKIIKSGVFYPILITGQSGNGKTMGVEQACAKLGRPMIRLNCTKKTDEEVLIGTKTLIDGSVVVKEGPMLIAMRSGAVVLLDEFSCSDPSSIMCIQGIMEGKPFYFPLTGEYIKPAHGFNVIMTDNTKGQGSEDGRFVGTNVLNEAFLERIGSVYEQEYPSMVVEKQILLKRMAAKGCVDDEFASNLVKWADAIRRTFADGGIDSVISTRRLGHIIDNFAIFGNKKKAVVQCTNRFQDTTKDAFVGLWKSLSVEDAPAKGVTEVI